MNSLMGDMTTTISWGNMMPDESFLWKKDGVTHPPLFEICRGGKSGAVPPGIEEFTSYSLGSVNFAISYGNANELLSSLTGALPQIHPKMFSLMAEDLQNSSHRLFTIIQETNKYNGVFFHPKTDFSQTYVYSMFNTDLEAKVAYDEVVKIADSGRIVDLKLQDVKESLFVFDEDTGKVRQLRTYMPEMPWEDQTVQVEN